MELEQMRQLVAVDRYGTISAAARALRISQSSLSRSMAALEAELGQRLFERGRNAAEFNDAGRCALLHARTLLADEQAMLDAFDGLARKRRTLRIASVAPSPVWRLTSLVVERCPGTILEPSLTDDADARHRLMDGTCDFTVTGVPVSMPTVDTLEFCEERLFANLPGESPLTGRDGVSFSDLDGMRCLVYAGSGCWIDLLRDMLPHSQVVVQEDRLVFLELVRTTDLLSFVTDAPRFPGYSQSGRVAVPVTDDGARVTYHLSSRLDAPEPVRQVMTWVRALAEQRG
ncbi:LysR family transcriptional regulator [Caniella muris]|uniref:LysR family transcriptional regulator n=1 Tax=Caniella muris TaxID=2941502 RepID=UPI00203A9065|nr:LysR family transcriptional regulator [Caniella muris]